MADAKAAWAGIARRVLIRTARQGGSISYKELADAVQVASGVRTRMLFRWWIGDVLTLVSELCDRRSEPELAALCVRQDGSIGAGFGEGTSPPDREARAAAERARCYDFFRQRGTLGRI